MIFLENDLVNLLNRVERNKEVLNPVFEDTWKSLKSGMDKGRLGRSKQLKGSFYQGVLKTKGWIKFTTPSQYTNGKTYWQYIKLQDMKDLDAVKEFSKKDIMRLMLQGDISLYCSCPDFLYRGFKYIGHNTGYGIYRETRFPKIRNPNLEGTVCKHLGSVLQVYMMNWSKIYKDYTKTYYFRDRYGYDTD